MSFGFSVGDFIAALELVGTVVASLREAGGVKSQFQELTRELFSLETALLRVKQLDFEEHQQAEYIALKQAAAQCQYTIDRFWIRASKYQKHLVGQGDASSLKAAWKKVQWALLRADELVAFKVDIASHTQSILMLLATLQMQQLDLQRKSTSAEFRSLQDMVERSFHQFYDRIAQVSNAVGASVAQGEQLLRRVSAIFQTNIRIFQTVRSIHSMLLQIPQGIEREQPVYMIDALGKTSPFHLEFVRSAAALKAILAANFEDIPSGPHKIDNSEFRLYDHPTGRQIDLSRPWGSCLLPGQKVEMRMVFAWTTRKRGLCPACGERCPRVRGVRNSQCEACGLIFTRTVKVDRAPTSTATPPTKLVVRDINSILSDINSDPLGPTAARKGRTAYDEFEDIQFYRRVHIVSQTRRKISQMMPAAPIEIPEDPTTGLSGNPIEDLNYLGDDIDGHVLESLLGFYEDFEEGDDEALRALSRDIIFEQLAGNEEWTSRLRSLIDAPDSDLSEIHPIAHHLKGSFAGSGLTNLSKSAEQMQHLAAWNLFHLSDEIRYRIGDNETELRAVLREKMDLYCEHFDTAKMKLQAFFKVRVGTD